MNDRLERCIGNVRAIPSEQIVHAVNDADGNMGRIRQRTIWERKTIDEGHHDFISFGQRVEHWNPIENFQPPFRGIRITSGSFEQDGIRDE